jgi:hypothetical protein
MSFHRTTPYTIFLDFEAGKKMIATLKIATVAMGALGREGERGHTWRIQIHGVSPFQF